MASTKPRSLLRIEYEEAAEAYLRSLPLEHFMESTDQARQREITVESLALVHSARPDIQYFSELLVQYPLKRGGIGQVVPDNMVVLCDQPIKAKGSFNLPVQPVGPFWVLKYVSKENKRKDYEENLQKYERELKVPYYLLFVPDVQELTLYRHSGRKYRTVKPNEAGRYPIEQLELEAAILDGWMRYWFRGELLPLPAELQTSLLQAQRRADEATLRAEELQRQLAETVRQLEEERAARRAAEQRGPGGKGPRRPRGGG
jgi:Uma2 family endonuclease